MRNLLTFYPKVSLGGDVHEVVGFASPATTPTTMIPHTRLVYMYVVFFFCSTILTFTLKTQQYFLVSMN